MSCVICCESLIKKIGRNELPDTTTSSGGEARKDTHAAAITETPGATDWQDQPSALSCGHVFHQICISAWLAQANRGTCPTCRKRHAGDPIALYFEVDTSDDMVIDTTQRSEESYIGQVRHRNQMIRTLCANVEAAQNEVRKMKQKVAEIEAKYAMEQAGRAEDNEKARKLKEKAALHKKQALEFKSAVLRLETAVAQQARQSEDLESKLAVSNGELDEQKRVILGMGDVRTVNEQLSRSLKKEKTRNETLNALNTQMASKIAALEQQLARLQSGDPAVSSSAATSNISESSSSRVEDDESEKYYSITDTETDFEEDAAAVSSSVTASLNRLRTAQPTTRLASTFELPLKAVDSTTKTAVNPFAAYLTTRKTTFDPSTFASSLNLSEGGRRVAGPPKSKAPQKRLICQPVPPSYSLRHPNTPMVISDGLGGSRRKPGSGTKGLRRSTTSVQAKINWGPKKP